MRPIKICTEDYFLSPSILLLVQKRTYCVFIVEDFFISHQIALEIYWHFLKVSPKKQICSCCYLN
jgi:hypothetical protein